MKSKTIAAVLAVLLICGVCQGQLQVYPAGTATAITVVSNTIKQTGAYDIYNANPRGPRIVRPTVHFKIAETGTNTTHYWAQIDFYINKSSSDTALTDWSLAHTDYWGDWDGKADTEQNSFVLACPWMDSYNFRYFYMDIHYPYGVVADSTNWTIYLVGDKGQNAPEIQANNFKRISHYELHKTNSALTFYGPESYESRVKDLRIEIIPGVFQMPDRGWIKIWGDGSQVDVSSCSVYVNTYMGKSKQKASYVDTLVVPLGLNTGGIVPFSFSLDGGGTGFIDNASFIIDHNVVADTFGCFMEVYLECDP